MKHLIIPFEIDVLTPTGVSTSISTVSGVGLCGKPNGYPAMRFFNTPNLGPISQGAPRHALGAPPFPRGPLALPA